MMSKKMKRGALGISSYGSDEDAKVRFKHQTLMQEFQELQRESEAMRNKLEAMKQRKITLLAEVRFLRQRRKFLLKNEVAIPPQRQQAQLQHIESRRKSTMKEKTFSKKEANPRNATTVFDVNEGEKLFKESARRNPISVLDNNQKDRIHSGKEATFRNTTPVFDLYPKESSYAGKEAIFRGPNFIFDLNQNERLYSGKETAPPSLVPQFDLNQMDRTYAGREVVVQNRSPIFDLNHISREEEELQNCEAFRIEDQRKFLSRGGTDEQPNDLKLSICRNAGSETSRAGKRKISWRDQVALKV
ncbi:hypothetical protein NMG60_11005683 [Bertholletia excelsa]